MRNKEELREIANKMNVSLEDLLFGMVEDSTKEIELLNIKIKELKDENFKLDYQNTRIKGALFEFEMNYYEDNLRGKNVV